MKDDALPESDHVSRYCGGGTLSESGDVTGTSFLLSPGDEYLSVNWLEFLKLDSREAEIEEVRRVLSTKLKLGATAKFATLNVGEVISYVIGGSPDDRTLRILHRPDEPADMPDPSHSGIFDTREDEQLIAELIAEKVLEAYPAQ